MINTRPWFVYIVETAAGRLYTGITVDVTRRMAQHTNGTGAKALRGDPPLALRYTETCGSRSEASVREHAIKRMRRVDKLRLIRQEGPVEG